MVMDLLRLKEHEDWVNTTLRDAARIHQLISLKFLKSLLNVPADRLDYEIAKELKREDL